MNTALETVKQWAVTFTDAPLWIQMAIALLVLGWILRAVPGFKSDWIPLLIPFIAAVAGYWLVPMQNPADWAFEVKDPRVADDIRRVAFSLTVGGGVVFLHKYAIKHAERWVLKKVKSWFGNGDQKPSEPGK